MKKVLHSIIFMFLMGTTAMAQDPHLTMFYAAPLYLNPALTGAFQGNYRISALYRQQWSSVLHNEAVPMYRTVTASVDFRTNKGFGKNDAFGIGASFLGDKAGESKFGYNMFGLALSYFKSLNSRGTHFLSAGVSSNIWQQSIDYSRLQFGTQWDGSAYNPALATQEFLVNNNFLFWDVNAGLLWYLKVSKRTNVYIGASAFHVNRPAVSFLGDKNVRLNMKFVGHGGIRFPLGNPDRSRFDMQPKFIVMFQGKNIETILGTDIRVLFEERSPEGDNFRLGVMFRMVGGDHNAAWRDKRMVAESVSVTAGVDWAGVGLNVAYDINVSELVTGSRSRGGFEVGLQYIGKWKPRKPQTIYCPKF